VGALPFHLYLALREDWIKVHTAAPESGENEDGGDDPFDFNAETLKGESV
jgi:hypothetical protein